MATEGTPAWLRGTQTRDLAIDQEFVGSGFPLGKEAPFMLFALAYWLLRRLVALAAGPSDSPRLGKTAST